MEDVYVVLSSLTETFIAPSLLRVTERVRLFTVLVLIL